MTICLHSKFDVEFSFCGRPLGDDPSPVLGEESREFDGKLILSHQSRIFCSQLAAGSFTSHPNQLLCVYFRLGFGWSAVSTVNPAAFCWSGIDDHPKIADVALVKEWHCPNHLADNDHLLSTFGQHIPQEMEQLLASDCWINTGRRAFRIVAVRRWFCCLNN